MKSRSRGLGRERGVQTLEDRSPVQVERGNVARNDAKHRRTRGLKGRRVHRHRDAVEAGPRVRRKLALLHQPETVVEVWLHPVRGHRAIGKLPALSRTNKNIGWA